jgi:Type IV secretion system pilin
MKKIKLIITTLALIIGVGYVALPAYVGAVDATTEACAVNPSSAICKAKGDSANTIIGTVVNTLLFILGAVAVIMVIIGGFMYTVSGGDAGAVGKAKNTILYAVIGLVVAFLAYAIVNWVLGAFKPVDPAAAGALVQLYLLG